MRTETTPRRWPIAAVLAFAVGAACIAAAVLVARDVSQLWSPPRIALYLVLPAAIGAAGIWVVLKQPEQSSLYLAYTAALATALLIAEVVLTHEQAPEPPSTASPHGKAAPDVVPQLCPGSINTAAPPYLVDGRKMLPLGGIAHARLAADPPHTADERGFNNPSGLWSRAPVDILAVGDSFTYGAGVPFGQSFVEIIRRSVPLTVNLGCGGNGPLAELAALVEHGPELRPRLVLWAFYEGNDLTKDVLFEAAAPLLAGYLKPGFRQGITAALQPEIDRAMREYLDGLRTKAAPAEGRAVSAPGRVRWREIVSLNMLRTRLGLRHSIRPESLVLFDQSLARAKAVAGELGSRLVLVYLPAETRYASVLGRADAEGYAAKVRTIVNRHGIPLIDVAAHFDHEREPRRLFKGHFTPEGYAKTAAIILDALTRGGLNWVR